MLEAYDMTARGKAARPLPEGLTLGLEGWSYAELYEPERLKALFELFAEGFAAEAPELAARWRQYLDEGDALDEKLRSAVIVEVAPFVSRFVVKLFGLQNEHDALRATVTREQAIFDFRKLFIRPRFFQRKAEAPAKDDADQATLEELFARLVPGESDAERGAAHLGLALLQLQKAAKKGDELGEAEQFCAETLTELLGDGAAGLVEDCERFLNALEHKLRALGAERPGSGWLSFYEVHKTESGQLVPVERLSLGAAEALEGEAATRRERAEPFALTDTRGSLREVAKEIDYCVLCHVRAKDSCSKGLREKDGSLRRNALGVSLGGCPLDEKIGEMHALRKVGDVVAALATVAIDNPMAPGTGHRICNDCMKGCIFQTQEPVNIPQIETRVLTDVLELPFGVELYQLLTRWNPLNPRRPYALPYRGQNVLVVGLGPAGYTLVHHLLNEGFGVVAIDGLKLEPLPKHLAPLDGSVPEPIRDFASLQEPLESRINYGFGGVSEYGITVRWDKNFLLLSYLTLARRPQFRAYGGVRFGGTLKLEDAWELGFDHVAIAAGAGRPRQVPMKQGMIRGIRTASDFLMGLQLTGAYKRNSLANVQVRLPAVVIGGGLTAIDTATELMAYYVVEAERIATRYAQLSAAYGEASLRAVFNPEELEVLDELRAHGAALQAERRRAQDAGETPQIQSLLRDWGGVSLAYRRSLQDAPAYRLNHEEVSKALEEGVRFIEYVSPTEAHPNVHGAVEALSFERLAPTEAGLKPTGETLRLSAKTVCIAAGTQPNVGYEEEYPGTFELDARGYFTMHTAKVAGEQVRLAPVQDEAGFFTSYLGPAGQTVSFYGDNHPVYAGSVVKAMASAKHGYQAVSALLSAQAPSTRRDWASFIETLDASLVARVKAVHRLADDIVEVVIHAPLAARKFEPGQFYRLQNFESLAPKVGQSPLVMEGLALTGASVDHEAGTLSTIALEMGSSSRMCSMLQPGEPVVLMGPTGAPTEIAGGETVLLAGGGLGNAVLFSIAAALRQRGSRVIYFAGYKRGEGLFKQSDVEAATDLVIWSTDSGAEITPRRPQDAHFRGNIVQAMLAYEHGELGDKPIALSEVDRIIAIGSDRMMAAVKEARRTVLAPYLNPKHRAIGSINSPMQCMMKAICAQCLQRVTDPETGESSLTYICANQDQELDRVDFPHLADRLRQNAALEKLGDLWFAHLVKSDEVPDTVPVERLSLRPVAP